METWLHHVHLKFKDLLVPFRGPSSAERELNDPQGVGYTSDLRQPTRTYLVDDVCLHDMRTLELQTDGKQLLQDLQPLRLHVFLSVGI